MRFRVENSAPKAIRCLAYALFLITLALPSAPQTVPQTSEVTLTGAPVNFPKVGSLKPLLLVLSFSHKGSSELASWNKLYKTQYATDQRVQYYELADFQGVPPFVMKMILHGMRRSVHEPERSHVVPFFSEEDAWKKLVNYGDPNIVYMVLANADGHVVWQTRGPATDSKAAELEAAVTRAAATLH